MRLRLRKPAQALNKAYAKQPIPQDHMDAFRGALARLFSRVDENESEEHQKTIVTRFLTEAFYSTDQFELSAQGAIDVVIQPLPDHQTSANQATPMVWIETRKVFAGEMMTTLKNNVRALHELILHYFEERDRNPNLKISQLIVTDVYNWFIFDEGDFQAVFYDNPKLRKLFNLKQQQKKEDTFFYGETARILRELDEEIQVTCLNLREIADALKLPPHQGNPILIPVFKLFSPQHLLSLPFTNDASTFNQRFYDELLHLLGLRETPSKKASDRNRQRPERLPEGERHDGSLLEHTISQLRINNVLSNLEFPEQYGDNETAQLATIGLELCVTWLNRLLFLKFTESQLVLYHRMASSSDEQPGSFISAHLIRTFNDLNNLFLAVIEQPASQESNRSTNDVKTIPYLACTLFEPTDLERHTIQINKLADSPELPLFAQTILADQHDQAIQVQQPTLHYLLSFLDAYEFLADSPAEVRPTDKPLINAVGLGLILDKLTNPHSDSSLATDVVATHLVSINLHRAVVALFNEHAVTPDRIDSIEELASVLSQFHKPSDLLRVNAVFNSLRIVDPCVGSGQFLLVALNELIALKAQLGILCDQSGHSLRLYNISIVEQELIVTDEANQPFQYYAPSVMNGASDSSYLFSSFSPAELQRVQETLFHEKQILLSTCLFGVDNNANAVNSCRLRLSIELLKNAYLETEGEGLGARGLGVENWERRAGGKRDGMAFSVPLSPVLVPFANLDLTIQVGHALIGQLGLGFRVDSLRNQSLRDRFLPAFALYSADVRAYKHCHDRAEREQIRARIREFRQFVHQLALVDDKDQIKIRQLEAKLAQSALPFDLTGINDQQQTLSNLLAAKKVAFAQKQRLFRQAFEWRFAFPEVLDEVGNYVGFDVVIGHPPTTRLGDVADAVVHFRTKFLSTYARSAPLYVLFIEQGMRLLRPGGRLAYLLPTKWLVASYATKLRQWLKTKAIEQIAELNHSLGPAKNCVLMVHNADTTGTFQTTQVDRLSRTPFFSGRTVEVRTDSLQDSGWVYDN